MILRIYDTSHDDKTRHQIIFLDLVTKQKNPTYQSSSEEKHNSRRHLFKTKSFPLILVVVVLSSPICSFHSYPVSQLIYLGQRPIQNRGVRLQAHDTEWHFATSLQYEY